MSFFLQGELYDVTMACVLAKAMNLSRVDIESDNKKAIELCPG